MARDISQLHPKLQKLANSLVEECKKQGITITITECLRTTAEQDALYAKGRTIPNTKIVTNAKGSSYSSMHQWGVAFDFALKMDIDGDGQVSDDAYNNSKKTFNKVGAIGKKLGLEWGGDWKSIVDLPHFQLPDWGSTTSKLRATYGTPDKFMKTWNTSTTSTTKTTAAATTTTTKSTTTTTTKKASVEIAKATIKKGAKGDNVKVLQKNLNSSINAGLKTDGDCGNNTIVALKSFQKKYDLTVDGVYGSKCETKMNSLLNK